MKVTSSYLRRLIAIELERALTEGRLLFEKEGDEPDAADELFDDEGGDEEPPEGDDGDAPAPKAATKASKDAASEEEPEVAPAVAPAPVVAPDARGHSSRSKKRGADKSLAGPSAKK